MSTLYTDNTIKIPILWDTMAHPLLSLQARVGQLALYQSFLSGKKGEQWPTVREIYREPTYAGLYPRGVTQQT